MSQCKKISIIHILYFHFGVKYNTDVSPINMIRVDLNMHVCYQSNADLCMYVINAGTPREGGASGIHRPTRTNGMSWFLWGEGVLLNLFSFAQMWDCIADICFAEDQSCYSFVQGPPGAPGMPGPTGKPGKNGDTGVPVRNLLVFMDIQQHDIVTAANLLN